MTDIASLLDTLRQARLLEPKQLDELAGKLQGRDLSPQVLTQKLVERGWLTSYQAQQLLQGRGTELLLGSYVVLDKLGEGGMGAVYQARHVNLDRTVALKVILKERITSADAVKRFQRETRAAAQLNHPNIVRAFDADAINGTHVLVMEYVAGTDLSRLVKERGPLPVGQACDYVRQAALGLQHAHEKGLVHRDIKPANLLLASKGNVVKILDLGLARLHTPDSDGETSSTLTQEGCVMGTPDYIAPEQAMGSHDVDIRADLYSLGCTLYFLLTGQPPFPGGALGAKLVRHQLDEPEPVEKLRPEVPPGIAAVVRRLIAKKPAERFQTPAEAAATLGEPGALATGVRPPPVANAPGSPRDSLAVLATSDTVSDRNAPHNQIARRRWRLGVAVLILLLLAGLGGFAFLLSRTDPPVARPGSTPAAPPRAASKFALDFDGRQSHVLLPGWKYKGEHPLTLEAWATPRSPRVIQALMSDSHASGVALNITQGLRPFPCWVFSRHDSKDYRAGVADAVVEPGRRIHVAGVFDGKEVRLYLNGRPQAWRSASEGYRPSPMPFLIGAKPGFGAPSPDGYPTEEFFDGLISEVRISRAARYMAAFEPAARFEPDPTTIALYHCDEGQGDVLRDASRNKQDGKIKGARWVPADQPVVTVPAPLPAVIDLLPLINLNQDVISGKWDRTRADEIAADGTSAPGIGGSRLEIPYHPSVEYDLRLSFTPNHRPNGMNAVLVGNGQQFRVDFGGFKNTVTQFTMLEFKNGKDNASAVFKEDGWLREGQRYEAVVQVRRGLIRAYLDNELILELKTDFKKLRLSGDWLLRDAVALGIGCYSAMTFHKVEVVEVTGFGEFTRPNDDAAKEAVKQRSTIWQALFNGRDLDGWARYEGGGVKAADVFSLTDRDGLPCLRVQDGSDKAILQTTRRSYRNYHLRVEYQWDAVATRDARHKFIYHRLGEDAANYFDLNTKGTSGSLHTWFRRRVWPGRVQDDRFVPQPDAKPTDHIDVRIQGAEKPTGEWNTLDLICLNSNVLHVLNGKVVAIGVDLRNNPDDKDSAVTSGEVGIQAVRGKLFIRRLDIRPITAIPPEFLK